MVYLVPSESLEDAVAEADRCYYEQRPQSKPFGGRTISDGWNHDVPKFPAGWLQPYREAWGQLDPQT